jgi:hypothetical protein
MKKVGKSTNRAEFEISTKTKIFEKKPNRGGTPAKERIARLSNFVKMFEAPKFEREKRVLISAVTACISVKKSKKEVTL